MRANYAPLTQSNQRRHNFAGGHVGRKPGPSYHREVEDGREHHGIDTRDMPYPVDAVDAFHSVHAV